MKIWKTGTVRENLLRSGMGCFAFAAGITLINIMLLPFVSGKLEFLVIIALTVLLFVTSLMQRRKPIRDYFNRLPMPVRSVVLSAILMGILVFGVPASSSYGGFMYAQF